MSTRERLIEAARRCLVTVGHQACSVKRIAAEAGVNAGLVHHHFGSKEALLLAVLEHEAATVRAAMSAENVDFVEGFMRPHLLEHPDRLTLVGEMLALSQESRPIADGVAGTLRMMRRLLAGRLGWPEEAAAALQGAVVGLSLIARVDPAVPVRAAVEMLVRRMAQPGPAAGPSAHTNTSMADEG